LSLVKHVNDNTFDSALPESGVALVDLSASWCGPCRAYAPIVENSAARNPDIAHLSVDIDESPELAQRFQIMSVPTTIFFRDGIFVGGFPGLLNASRLDDLIKQTKDLDMDHVRTSISKKKQ